MNQPLTVYVIAGCSASAATITALDDAQVGYRVVNLEQDGAGREVVRQLGFMTTPVVTVGMSSWCGYRPDLLVAVITARQPDPYLVPVDPMEALQCDSCQ